MPSVAMLYICTGPYRVFWPGFYRSFGARFLPECEKSWFVFTDAEHIEGETDPAVHKIAQEAWPWPYSTLRRFTVFLRAEEELKKCDYVFFCNANLVCEQAVTAAEFLPRAERGETLTLVQQPGFWNKKPIFYSYDRDPKCRACIPYNCGRDYVSGGLNGGTAAAFLALCHELERRTEADLADGVIARWHDESQLNRYAAERPGAYRLLTPAYWYPEGWDLPFEQKITVLDKSKWFDVAGVKNDAPRPRPWWANKWEAFWENRLPYLCWLRDTVLHKTL